MVLPSDRFGAQAKYIDSLVPGAAPLYHFDCGTSIVPTPRRVHDEATPGQGAFVSNGDYVGYRSGGSRTAIGKGFR